MIKRDMKNIKQDFRDKRIYSIRVGKEFRNLICNPDTLESEHTEIYHFKTAREFCEAYRQVDNNEIIKYYKTELQNVLNNTRKAIEDKGLSVVASIEFGYNEVTEENTETILEYNLGEWYIQHIFRIFSICKIRGKHNKYVK